MPRPLSRTVLKKRTNRTAVQKRFSFSMSFPGLCVIIISSVMALCWSFVFGVIIGRGYNPEHQLSKITRLLPEPDTSQDIVQQSILKPEDLNFMLELKQEPKIEYYTSNSPKKEVIEPTQNKNETIPTIVSSVKEEEIPKTKNTASTSEQKEKKIISKDTTKSVESNKKTMIYDFIFQVASFKKEAQADKLREKLEEEGIRTQLTIHKNPKGEPSWYHVRALLRGIETEAVVLKDSLLRLKLTDAKIISKEPTGRQR